MRLNLPGIHQLDSIQETFPSHGFDYSNEASNPVRKGMDGEYLRAIARMDLKEESSALDDYQLNPISFYSKRSHRRLNM